MPLLHQLTTAAEIEEYAAEYEKASGYRVPIEYLHRSLVFGFVRGGRLRGGVVMSGASPFRTLQRVPEPHRAAVAAAIDPDDTIELVCVWLNPALRRGLTSALFWLGLFLESGRRGARSVLFGTESRGLCEMYLLGRPRLLYSGEVTVDGVRKHGWIFHSPVAHRWPALRRIALYKLRGRRRDSRDSTARAAPALGGPSHAATQPPSGQASRAAGVPLRGLAVAAREIARSLRRRIDGRGRRQAAAALGAASVDGAWALVTGASSGIGLAFAEQLAHRGAGLLLVADDDEVCAVAERLRVDARVRVEALVADLSTRSGIDAVIAWAAGRRVEVLVNNAGLGLKGPFAEGDADEYERLVGVNVLAPVVLTRALLPGMSARRRGAVIHVASVNALAPIPRSAVYSATKTFLLTYATAVWYELRDRGIVFQTLLPGTTATGFHAKQRTRVPSWAMTPSGVAASSLSALGRDLVHVPGLLNKVFRLLASILPLGARTAAAGAALTASLGTLTPTTTPREELIV
jgi:short-subunit dehydrogenase